MRINWIKKEEERSRLAKKKRTNNQQSKNSNKNTKQKNKNIQIPKNKVFRGDSVYFTSKKAWLATYGWNDR